MQEEVLLIKNNLYSGSGDYPDYPEYDGGVDLGTKILCEIILSIIAISGIIGNIISIYVFSRPKMVSSIIYRILIGMYFTAILVMDF